MMLSVFCCCAAACMNPATQGKASGALCLLTLFGQANKVRRVAVRKLPVFINFINQNPEAGDTQSRVSPNTGKDTKLGKVAKKEDRV